MHPIVALSQAGSLDVDVQIVPQVQLVLAVAIVFAVVGGFALLWRFTSVFEKRGFRWSWRRTGKVERKVLQMPPPKVELYGDEEKQDDAEHDPPRKRRVGRERPPSAS